MKAPETPTEDLIQLLAQPTEPKPEPNKASNNSQEKPTEPLGANPTDFFPEQKQPEPEPEPVKAKPRLSESEYEQQAEMCIALFDGFQTLTLPWLYQKSLFTKEELDRLQKLKDKKDETETTYTEEDLALFEKYETYKEFRDNVEYTDEEIKVLKSPLAKVFSKYNVQIGPEFLLISALVYVSAPRYLPLISKFE